VTKRTICPFENTRENHRKVRVAATSFGEEDAGILRDKIKNLAFLRQPR
jgi:hypothetical protein